MGGSPEATSPVIANGMVEPELLIKNANSVPIVTTKAFRDNEKYLQNTGHRFEGPTFLEGRAISLVWVNERSYSQNKTNNI